jgi:hypothetical protein
MSEHAGGEGAAEAETWISVDFTVEEGNVKIGAVTVNARPATEAEREQWGRLVRSG